MAPLYLSLKLGARLIDNPALNVLNSSSECTQGCVLLRATLTLNIWAAVQHKRDNGSTLLRLILLLCFAPRFPPSSLSIYTRFPFVSPGYGVEHAQCVPPSEYSEPGFITESYQTLHPISSEELLTLKYESEYPAVILRDTPLNPLQGDYFSVKQEVVSPDNMCVGRLSRGEGSHVRYG